MTRAVQIAELGDQNVFTIDSSNNRVGIGSTQPTEKLDVNDGAITVGTGITIDSVSGIISATGANVTGVVTAAKFIGPMEGTLTGNISGTAAGLSGSPDITITNLTGVAATFSGNVNISGTLTYEDVTNIDSVGIITAQSHVSIADSILHTGDTDTAIRFPAANTFTVETAGSERLRVDSSGHVLTSNFDTSSASGGGSKLWQTGSFHVQLPSSLSSSYLIRGFSGTTETFNVYNDGSALFKGNITVPDKIIHDGDTNTSIRFPTDDTVTVETAGSERFRVTSTGGVHFNNAELIERVSIAATNLSNQPNINLDNGMIHHFTGIETTTATPNIISTAGINTNMAVGDAMSVTIITTAAAAGYAATVHIDGLPLSNNSGSLNWNGGSAPSAGGSSGNDFYTYSIIKTGNATYTVLANVANFA